MEEKILEKEYRIPFEFFEKSFTQWQKKFVYPKTYIISILFLILGVVYIISAVKDSSNVMSYVLSALCLGLSAVNWYNPKKAKTSLLNAVKLMEDETYKMTVFETFIEISTIIQENSENNNLDESEDKADENNEKELFGDELPEVIESSKLYFNNGLKVLEYDEYFIIYQVKELYYVVPKLNFTESELEIFRKKTMG
ncbi:MAG: hypothetical protein K2G63_06000 [Oscillospiraceae bacterium]|nr:hypothetical protein [Oscillospiraceae bacterium]